MVAEHREDGAVHRRPPHPRPAAGPVRVLRGVRLALVRGHLPAAVPVADRLPAAAQHRVRRPTTDAAGGHPAQPRAAAASPHRRGRGIARPGRRPGDRRPQGLADRPARRAGPWARPSRDDLRREGLCAGGRQPRLPPVAAGAAGRDRSRQAGRLRGVGDRQRRLPVLLHLARVLRQLPARAAGRRHSDGAVLRERQGLHRDLHRRRRGQRVRRAGPGAKRRGRRHRPMAGRRTPGQRPTPDGRRAAVPARPRLHPALPDHLPGRHGARLLADVRPGAERPELHLAGRDQGARPAGRHRGCGAAPAVGDRRDLRTDRVPARLDHDLVVPGTQQPGRRGRRLPRRPGHGGRPGAVGVRHRHLAGRQGAADQAGAGEPDGRASRSRWTTAPRSPSPASTNGCRCRPRSIRRSSSR